MSLLDLPPELHVLVCSALSSPDIFSLMQSCSSLYPSARRQLYRHIQVSPSLCNLSVVLSLAQDPALARCVRSFHVDTCCYSNLFHAFYRQLARALAEMTELLALDLFIAPTHTWVLQSICAPSLLRFAASFTIDSHVFNFLSKLDALVQLELPSIHYDAHVQKLPDTSLPYLSQFSGSCDVAQATIPSRPVSLVHLSSGDMTDSILDGILHSSADITVLSASSSIHPANLMWRLVETAPNVVYLQIQSTFTFSAAPDSRFYSEIAQALASLPSLKYFELSGIHWGSLKTVDDARLWQTRPSLLEVAAVRVEDEWDEWDEYSSALVGYC